MSKNIARTIRPAVIDADEYDERDEIVDEQYDDEQYDDTDTDGDEYDDDPADDTDGADEDDEDRPGGSWEPEMRKNRATRRAEAKRRSGTRVPSNAKRPKDRQPKRAARRPAAQREAEIEPGDVVVLEFRGRKFEIPADMDDWPTLAHQAFAKQLHYDALEYLLGPQQWAILVTNVAHTRRDFVRFSNMVAREFGFGTPGN